MINVTDIGNFGIVQNINQSCKDSLNVNQIVKDVCNQYKGYIRTLGFAVIIGYILATLGGWWFFNYGYKTFKIDYFNDLDKRIEWDQWFRHVMYKWAIGYIAVVIWLSF